MVIVHSTTLEIQILRAQGTREDLKSGITWERVRVEKITGTIINKYQL